MGARLVGDVAECKEGAAQDEPDEGQCEEGIEAQKRALEQEWKPGPAQHDGHDKPHVVDLPHGRHRVVDQGPSLAAAGGLAGEQVPDARAEIDAARRAVGGDGEKKRDRDQVGNEVHELSTPGSRAGRGPYGAPSSGAGPACKSSRLQRAASLSSRVTKK